MNNKKRKNDIAKLMLCMQTIYAKLCNKANSSLTKNGVNTQKRHRQLITAF